MKKLIHLRTNITVQHTYRNGAWHITVVHHDEHTPAPNTHMLFVSLITIIMLPHILLAMHTNNTDAILFAPYPVYLILALVIATYITKCLIKNQKS